VSHSVFKFCTDKSSKTHYLCIYNTHTYNNTKSFDNYKTLDDNIALV